MRNTLNVQRRLSPIARSGIDGQRVPESARAAGRCLRNTLALALVCLMSTACYSYVPLATAPVPGTEVRFELNDQGRAALADSIGPGTRSVLGKVRAATASGYDVAMGSVENINGMVQQWSGELLHIRTEYVALSQERRLDSKRSWVAGIGTTLGLIAAILGADLLGGSSIPETGVDPPPDGTQ